MSVLCFLSTIMVNKDVYIGRKQKYVYRNEEHNNMGISEAQRCSQDFVGTSGLSETARFNWNL